MQGGHRRPTNIATTKRQSRRGDDGSNSGGHAGRDHAFDSEDGTQQSNSSANRSQQQQASAIQEMIRSHNQMRHQMADLAKQISRLHSKGPARSSANTAATQTPRSTDSDNQLGPATGDDESERAMRQIVPTSAKPLQKSSSLPALSRPQLPHDLNKPVHDDRVLNGDPTQRTKHEVSVKPIDGSPKRRIVFSSQARANSDQSVTMSDAKRTNL